VHACWDSPPREWRAHHGVGPVPAVEKLVSRLAMKVSDFDVVELNEAFASQALACTRAFGFADDAEHVNSNGGAIALGHPWACPCADRGSGRARVAAPLGPLWIGYDVRRGGARRRACIERI